MVMLFAGVQKDDSTRLHAIMKFPDLEALQAFGAYEKPTEERRQAGAETESGVLTLMVGDESLTNFPAPFTVDYFLSGCPEKVSFIFFKRKLDNETS